MLRSHFPLDPHEAHLRHLIDQRAMSSDFRSRIPSMSEFSDTPSLYSHAYFSPQPAHFNNHIEEEMSSNFASPTRSDHNMLNDLAVSMLDMDDEPRSSYSSNDYNDNDADDGDQSTVGQETVEDDDTEPVPSMFGPKMRFHSKAPWEDDSPPQEEYESEDDADVRSVMSSSRNKSAPSRFRFGGSKSSRDSSRSRHMGKKSFDTTSSHGRSAIHTLAQAGMSSASLVSGSRPRFLSGRVRSSPPSSPPLSPSSPRSPVFFAEHSPVTRRSGSGDSDSRPSFSYSIEDTHPYARSTLQDRSVSKKSNIPASDTFSTLTDSTPSDSLIKPQSRSSVDVESSHELLPQSPRLHASFTQGREISSPLSVRSAALPSENADLLPPRTGSLSGWTDNATPPSFSLISLEEARAQRSRSNTNPNPSFTASAVTFPIPEGGQSEHGLSQSITSRARARSISAGVRAKQALTSMVGTPPKPERRGSEPSALMNHANDSASGKNLKHKKSGFMRLFNSGRDEKSPPPPVPSLSEGYAAFNAQQSAPKGIKIARVPPPPVSPSLLEKHHSGDELQTSFLKVSSPKRTPPPLSLVGSHVAGALRPHFPGDIAQSAPANVTEFPSLKLRPISTVFSAEFGDHILPSLTSDDDEPDTPSSLQSPGAVISPITPGPYTRPVHGQMEISQLHNSKTAGSAAACTSPAEDQSAVIRALQNQIVAAKLAWQRQIWELEGQVRELETEVEELRTADVPEYCAHCGRGTTVSSGESSSASSSVRGDGEKPISVVHRPRARTGTGQSRFGSAV